MDQWPLPEGWEWRKLKQLATKDSDTIRPADHPDVDFDYLSLGDIESGAWKPPELTRVKGSEVRSTNIQFDTRHVLYSKLRPYLNKVVVPQEPGVGSTELIPLVPDPSILLREYLAWYLRSPQFLSYAEHNSTGARMPRLRMASLWSTQVPLPPLDVQRRLVARIETLLAEVDTARRLQDVIEEKTKRVTGAAMLDVFEQAEQEDWQWRQVKDIIQDKPQYGTSEKATEEPVGIPVLRMGNIVDGTVSFEDLKYIDLPSDEEAKYLLSEGDILFNRTNSAELVGKTAVYPGGRRAIFASYLIRIIAHPERAVPGFIVAYINSPLGRRYIEAQRTRSIGQANVNATKLKKMPIPVPLLPEQHRIVAYLDEVQAHVADLRAAAAALAADLERTEQAILARAFRGEL